MDYGVKNGKVILNLDKIEDLGSFLKGEKVTIIDFERELDEEVKSKIENYRRMVKDIENELGKANNEDSKKKLEEKKQELENRIKTLESIEVINPYKIDKIINEVVEYLVGG